MRTSMNNATSPIARATAIAQLRCSAARQLDYSKTIYVLQGRDGQMIDAGV